MTEYNVALLQSLVLYHAPYFLSESEQERAMANMFLGTIVNVSFYFGCIKVLFSMTDGADHTADRLSHPRVGTFRTADPTTTRAIYAQRFESSLAEVDPARNAATYRFPGVPPRYCLFSRSQHHLHFHVVRAIKSAASGARHALESPDRRGLGSARQVV